MSADDKLRRAIARQLVRRPDLAAKAGAVGLDPEKLSDLIADNPGLETTERPRFDDPEMLFAESIILEVGRPTLLVQNGTFELPADEGLAGWIEEGMPFPAGDQG